MKLPAIHFNMYKERGRWYISVEEFPEVKVEGKSAGLASFAILEKLISRPDADSFRKATIYVNGRCDDAYVNAMMHDYTVSSDNP